jgi:hypothetical protein
LFPADVEQDTQGKKVKGADSSSSGDEAESNMNSYVVVHTGCKGNTADWASCTSHQGQDKIQRDRKFGYGHVTGALALTLLYLFLC